MAMTELGHVTAMEGAPEALRHLERRGGLTVVRGVLPNSDLSPGSFDLVTGFDVLEHIEDDRTALRDIVQTLKPGGLLMLTVPAHPWMWSVYDEHMQTMVWATWAQASKQLRETEMITLAEIRSLCAR